MRFQKWRCKFYILQSATLGVGLCAILCNPSHTKAKDMNNFSLSHFEIHMNCFVLEYSLQTILIWCHLVRSAIFRFLLENGSITRQNLCNLSLRLISNGSLWNFSWFLSLQFNNIRVLGIIYGVRQPKILSSADVVLRSLAPGLYILII